MTFKSSFRFPSKTPNAWFYYSLICMVLAGIEGVSSAHVHSKSFDLINIISVTSNLLTYLFLLLFLLQIVVNFMHLVKEKPKFNFKKIVFVISLAIGDYLLLAFQYAIVQLLGGN